MTNDEIQMTNAASFVRRRFTVFPLLRHLDFDIRHFQWGVKDLNLRRHCHQIYSLTPLTTRETPRFITNDEIQMTNAQPPLAADYALFVLGISSSVILS